MTNVSAVDNSVKCDSKSSNKIRMSWGDYLFTALMVISVVGLFYQSWKLQEALQSGLVNEVEERIRKGGWLLYKHTINADDIRSLAKDNKCASLRVIRNQIDFDIQDPTGGSNAAQALIVARDLRDSSEKIHKNADRVCSVVLKALPYNTFPETKYYSSRPSTSFEYAYFAEDIIRWV